MEGNGTGMRLYDKEGNRLYLTAEERKRFLAVAKKQNARVRTFAEVLVYTGCRISEALELVPKSIEREESKIVFRSLKKRTNDIYRSVPVPEDLIDVLTLAHELIKLQKNAHLTASKRLFPWTRQHAHTIVKGLMIEAEIMPGRHRTAKGLRHAYGVNAITKGIPLNMLQRWMGHADIKTTAIYANAIGEEEKSIAARMW